MLSLTVILKLSNCTIIVSFAEPDFDGTLVGQMSFVAALKNHVHTETPNVLPFSSEQLSSHPQCTCHHHARGEPRSIVSQESTNLALGNKQSKKPVVAKS